MAKTERTFRNLVGNRGSGETLIEAKRWARVATGIGSRGSGETLIEAKSMAKKMKERGNECHERFGKQ